MPWVWKSGTSSKEQCKLQGAPWAWINGMSLEEWHAYRSTDPKHTQSLKEWHEFARKQHELEGAVWTWRSRMSLKKQQRMSLAVPPANLLSQAFSLPLSHLVSFVFIVQEWPGKETISWLQQNPLSTALSRYYNRSSIHHLPLPNKWQVIQQINSSTLQTEVFCYILIDFIIRWTMNGSTQTLPTFRPASPTETLQMDICPLAIHLPRSTILGLLTVEQYK